MVIFIPSLFSFHILSVYLPYTPIKGYTMKDINRIKVVLVEQKKTGKWLAEQLGKIHLLCLNGVQTKCNRLWRC